MNCIYLPRLHCSSNCQYGSIPCALCIFDHVIFKGTVQFEFAITHHCRIGKRKELASLAVQMSEYLRDVMSQFSAIPAPSPSRSSFSVPKSAERNASHITPMADGKLSLSQVRIRHTSLFSCGVVLWLTFARPMQRIALNLINPAHLSLPSAATAPPSAQSPARLASASPPVTVSRPSVSFSTPDQYRTVPQRSVSPLSASGSGRGRTDAAGATPPQRKTVTIHAVSPSPREREERRERPARQTSSAFALLQSLVGTSSRRGR